MIRDFENKIYLSEQGKKEIGFLYQQHHSDLNNVILVEIEDGIYSDRESGIGFSMDYIDTNRRWFVIEHCKMIKWFLDNTTIGIIEDIRDKSKDPEKDIEDIIVKRFKAF